MAAKSQPKTQSIEKRESSGTIGRIIAAVLLYGLTLLLAYIALAIPETGTAMGSIRAVLNGLGGSLAVVLPLILAWIATLCALSAAGRKISIWRSAVDGVLFLALFTAVQLFVTENIIRNRMTIQTFANYVSKSYGYGAGGGALGALLAWPLYRYLGKWGGLLATLLLAVLSLTITGKAMRLVRWLSSRSQEIHHDTQQRRMERDNERMFEIDDRSRRRSDPAGGDMHLPTRRPIDADAAEPAERARRRPRNGRPVQDDWEASAKAAQDNWDALSQDDWETPPAKPARNAKVKPSKARVQAPKDGDWDEENTLLDDPFPMAADDSPTMAAFDGSKRRKRDRKARPDVPESLRAGGKPAESSAGQEAPSPAPSKSRAAKPAFDPETVRASKAQDGQISMDDDLTIEPETCDVLEGGDAPAEAPIPKKLPKLKRTMQVEYEEEDPYNYPPIDLLEQGESVKENFRDSDMEKAALLEDTLKQFGITTKLTGIAHGPAVTRFELQPAPGVKVSRITSLADDIAMHLAAMSVRIEAPIPGKAAVGVEIPNDKVEMVRLRDVLESPEARKSPSKVAVGLGKDNSGRYIVADIAKMPHVLIAGQTGSGKSVCINSIITSILFRATPEEVRLILIDPKVVELSIYNDIPHLVCPVVTDCKKASSALQWAVAEMTMRYKRFAERGVRDIKGYNKALREGEKIMPQMVIIIDELADLMMVAPGEVEDSICRLAQLARAAGMHLVIATQRPSVNVITGIIKANIPTRIAFSVASQVDSRTMIDHGGAEKLLGNGDMLFVPSGINKPMRVQGAWVSDEEVHAIVSYIKERSETTYDADMIEQMDNAARSDAEKEDFAAEYDPRLPEAVEIVVEAGQASVSMLQRRMRVGYARAGRLIDEMQQRGIVSEADGAKPRTVLISREEMNALFEPDE